MNLGQSKHIVFSLAISSLLLFGLFLLLMLNALPSTVYAWPVTPAVTPNPPGTRPPGPAFVKPGGTGGWCLQDDPCGSIQYAIDQCEPGNGDTIYVAGGSYTGTDNAVITVTKSITLYGGWDGTTTTPPVRDPNVYPTTLDGQGQRRVVFITGTVTPTIDGFIITGGNATDLGGSLFDSDAGGGIYSYAAYPIIQNNVITHNLASTQPGERAMGGGIYAESDGFVAINSNRILSNTAGIDANLADGGGLFVMGPGEVRSNTFEENVACQGGGCTGRGGGIYVGWTDDGLEVVGNRFINNQAANGGGLHLVWSAVHVAENTVHGNRAVWGAGMYSYYDKGSVIEANTVTSNTASIGGGGIGIYITPDNTRPTVVNNVIARNRAPGRGGGFYAWSDWNSSSITFTHNTLVDNGKGVAVGTNMTVTLTNNSVVSHTLGITTTDPSATAPSDHNLFWSNNNDGIRGTNPVDGDPCFVDPAGGDYHIAEGSATIDAGVDTGVTTDIDGDTRPIGSGYDIGADERRLDVYLPLVVRSFP